MNIAPSSLQRADFVRRTLETLERSGAPADRLTFEITERGALECMGEVAARMESLRDHGVRFALDDFGTGYSSLVCLKRLPLDEVKIDRSFVRGVIDDPGDRSIVDAIIAVARRFGRGVTAKGVESLAQAVHLNAAGCDTLQGYLFARSLPPDEFEHWLVAVADAAEEGSMLDTAGGETIAA